MEGALFWSSKSSHTVECRVIASLVPTALSYKALGTANHAWQNSAKKVSRERSCAQHCGLPRTVDQSMHRSSVINKLSTTDQKVVDDLAVTGRTKLANESAKPAVSESDFLNITL